MKIYQLRRSQWLPLSIDAAWEFFSRPVNLPLITPPWLNMTVISSLPEKMHPGMITTYRIQPVFRIPLTWITEITHVQRPNFFVDEQRFGPYRFWHHQHSFTPKNDGIDMHDIVRYGLKFGIIGRLIHRYWVRSRLEDIFDYRKEQLRRRLPVISTAIPAASFNR